MRAYGVYPRRGQKFSRRRDLHVQRRIPDQAATLLAERDEAPKPIGATERSGCVVQIAVDDWRRAYRAGRDRHAAGVESGRRG